jgi:hypothetical protein
MEVLRQEAGVFGLNGKVSFCNRCKIDMFDKNVNRSIDIASNSQSEPLELLLGAVDITLIRAGY